MRYSNELRDQIIVKGYAVLTFAKTIGKNKSKVVNTLKVFLITLNNVLQMHLKSQLQKSISKHSRSNW